MLGFAVVGVFVATWALALAVWRVGRIEERWAAARQADRAFASTLSRGSLRSESARGPNRSVRTAAGVTEPDKDFAARSTNAVGPQT